MAQQQTRKALATVYINPDSPGQLKDIASYTLANGEPAIDVVCLFAGNYAASKVPYLRANNNQPPTTKPLNPNIQEALDDGSVKYLQDKGIKVLLTVMNGHAPVGWSEFTSEKDAEAFAQYLKSDVVDKYGLDGIDIDDEYSSGAPNDTSLIMVTTLMRALMPDKIISKALWADLSYFQNTWVDSNGKHHRLVENLNYGWYMGYGDALWTSLEPYLQLGMHMDQLSMGFWSGRPAPKPCQDITSLRTIGLAGFMAFNFEASANVKLTGQLVDCWYGPGNWNHP